MWLAGVAADEVVDQCAGRPPPHADDDRGKQQGHGHGDSE